MRTWVWFLASLSGLRIWHCLSCGVGHRNSTDLALLWLCLWHRLAAASPIRPLAWALAYVSHEALKSKKKKKKKRKNWEGARVAITIQWWLQGQLAVTAPGRDKHTLPHVLWKCHPSRNWGGRVLSGKQGVGLTRGSTQDWGRRSAEAWGETRVTTGSWFAQGCPGFSTKSPMSRKCLGHWSLSGTINSPAELALRGACGRDGGRRAGKVGRSPNRNQATLRSENFLLEAVEQSVRDLK